MNLLKLQNKNFMSFDNFRQEDNKVALAMDFKNEKRNKMKENLIEELPEDYEEYDGEELMSNFDGAIVNDTAGAIKGKKLYSRYAGWNFNGKVWWQNDKWNCEVWCYKSLQKVVRAETLEEIMELVSGEFGND